MNASSGPLDRAPRFKQKSEHRVLVGLWSICCVAAGVLSAAAVRADSPSATMGSTATATQTPTPASCLAITERALAGLGVAPTAAAKWAGRARRSALLPTVKARASYTDYSGQYWPTGEATTALDASYRNGRQLRVDVELGWDLGRVAWQHDELAISRERARIAERRRNVRGEIVELCFAKAQAVRALATAHGDERSELILDLARLDARLAAMADGDEQP